MAKSDSCEKGLERKQKKKLLEVQRTIRDIFFIDLIFYF